MLSKISKRTIWIIFISLLIITVSGDFFIHRHSNFGIDGYFGFPALFGFLCCVFLIIFSKIIGLFLKRPDNYYDE